MSALALSSAPSPRNSISPMCETSNTPAAFRTASCSATTPVYWTGMSQPAKSTIRAPSARCTRLSGVWRAMDVAPDYSTGLRAIKALHRHQSPGRPRLREPRRPCLPGTLQPVALALVELPADVLEERRGQVEVVGEVRIDGRLHDEVRPGDRVPVRDRRARLDRV